MNRIVTAQQWQSEYQALLSEEKRATQIQDALAAKRRALSWQRVDSAYEFHSSSSSHTLNDLFDGRKQLIVYHHMLKENDASPCSGCSMVLDNLGHLAHLHARNTSFAVVSVAPIEQINAFKQRMQWTMPWFQTSQKFNSDFDVEQGFGVNVFYQSGESIVRSYFSSGRGVESLGSNWSYLDITPLGRQETWELSPDHVVQSPPYQWWRLHDEYSDES